MHSETIQVLKDIIAYEEGTLRSIDQFNESGEAPIDRGGSMMLIRKAKHLLSLLERGEQIPGNALVDLVRQAAMNANRT